MSKTLSPAARGDSSSTSISTDLDSAEQDAVASMAGERVEHAVVKGKNSDLQLSGERVVINISMIATETGAVSEGANGPLFIGLNGFGYHIPRGKNVSVPVEVLDILDNAIQKSYPTKNGIIQGAIDVPRHAYRVIRNAKA